MFNASGSWECLYLSCDSISGDYYALYKGKRNVEMKSERANKPARTRTFPLLRTQSLRFCNSERLVHLFCHGLIRGNGKAEDSHGLTASIMRARDENGHKCLVQRYITLTNISPLLVRSKLSHQLDDRNHMSYSYRNRSPHR